MTAAVALDDSLFRGRQIKVRNGALTICFHVEFFSSFVGF